MHTTLGVAGVADPGKHDRPHVRSGLNEAGYNPIPIRPCASTMADRLAKGPAATVSRLLRASLWALSAPVLTAAAAPAPLDYTLELRESFAASTDGGKWFQPRPVAVPTRDGSPLAVMTIQKAIGSDFFTGLSTSRSTDGGRTWTVPQPQPGLGWRAGEGGLDIGVCDVTLAWHAPSRKVIGIGHTATYTKKGFAGIEHRRDTVWITYDPANDRWTPWREFVFPPTSDQRTFINGVHGQFLVEPDGSLLVPYYFLGPKIADKKWQFSFRGAVARMTFDGDRLEYVTQGAELNLPVPRGLYEKSITWFAGRYYLTMRNDQRGYVAVSDDGLNFGPIQPWTFDDGSDLGSYNTQQKWVTHSEGLFLVYTRRGANNDHIPRNRAPLFIARVDPDRLHVLRATERIAVPERGADIGNFDATTVSPGETWITAAGGPSFLAVVRWSKPNGLAGRVN